jgi:hypothetical protein
MTDSVVAIEVSWMVLVGQQGRSPDLVLIEPLEAREKGRSPDLKQLDSFEMREKARSPQLQKFDEFGTELKRVGQSILLAIAASG